MHSSDESNALDPTTSLQIFRLGSPLRQTSPTYPPYHPGNQLDVLSFQRQHATTELIASNENGDTESSTSTSPIPFYPLPEHANDIDPPRDSEDDGENEVLPMPPRLRAKFKDARKERRQERHQELHQERHQERHQDRHQERHQERRQESPEAIQWQRH